MRNLAIRYGAIFGMVFSLVGVVFVAFSIFTDVSRALWLGLNQINGVVGIGLCGLAGCLVGRRTENVRLAALAGMLAGAIGGAAVSAALYIFPYSFIEHVRQYPFEHYSYLNSGAANIREYLLSERGRHTVTETSLGLMPTVAPIAAVLGGAVATLGGWIGQRSVFKRLLLATPVVLVTLMVFGLWSDARQFATPLPTHLNKDAGTGFSSSGLPTGSTRIDTMERVVRGGAWGGPASSARSARRSKNTPSYRSITLGIRLVSNSVARN